MVWFVRPTGPSRARWPGGVGGRADRPGDRGGWPGGGGARGLGTGTPGPVAWRRQPQRGRRGRARRPAAGGPPVPPAGREPGLGDPAAGAPGPLRGPGARGRADSGRPPARRRRAADGVVGRAAAGGGGLAGGGRHAAPGARADPRLAAATRIGVHPRAADCRRRRRREPLGHAGRGRGGLPASLGRARRHAGGGGARRPGAGEHPRHRRGDRPARLGRGAGRRDRPRPGRTARRRPAGRPARGGPDRGDRLGGSQRVDGRALVRAAAVGDAAGRSGRVSSGAPGSMSP